MKLKRPREVWRELQQGMVVAFAAFGIAAILLALGRTLEGLQILQWQQVATLVLWISGVASLALAAYFACAVKLFNTTSRHERQSEQYGLEYGRTSALLRKLEAIAGQIKGQ